MNESDFSECDLSEWEQQVPHSLDLNDFLDDFEINHNINNELEINNSFHKIDEEQIQIENNDNTNVAERIRIHVAERIQNENHELNNLIEIYITKYHSNVLPCSILNSQKTNSKLKHFQVNFFNPPISCTQLFSFLDKHINHRFNNVQAAAFKRDFIATSPKVLFTYLLTPYLLRLKIVPNTHDCGMSSVA